MRGNGVDKKDLCDLEIEKARSEVQLSDLVIDDVDFSAKFSGSVCLLVRWKWTMAPDAHNKVACYHIPDEIRKPFDSEVEQWIAEEIFVPVPSA